MPARKMRHTLAVLAVTIAAVGLAAMPSAADTTDTATPGDSAHDLTGTIIAPADSAW